MDHDLRDARKIPRGGRESDRVRARAGFAAQDLRRIGQQLRVVRSLAHAHARANAAAASLWVAIAKPRSDAGYTAAVGASLDFDEARKRSYENLEFFDAFFGGNARGRARNGSESRTVGG
jgi:hypothetical protein